MYGKKEGIPFERILPYQKCEESDWDKFPPPSNAHSDSFAKIRSSEIGGMYCLDWEGDGVEDKLIYGHSKNDEYQRLDIVLVPCNYVHSYLGYEGDSIPDECLAD